jgi:hypothetical protein
MVWGLTLYSFKVFEGSGRIIGIDVGVYWDSNCDNPIVSLSWGEVLVNPLMASESKNVTVFIQNKGTKPITLFLNTSSWDPPFLSKYINLGWDYDGHVLESMDVEKVNLILSIDSSIRFEFIWMQHYSFNIVISASSL